MKAADYADILNRIQVCLFALESMQPDMKVPVILSRRDTVAKHLKVVTAILRQGLSAEAEHASEKETA